ncbi:MAG: TonB-dependent receptor, partial [Bacteroidia bacterium]|nr:TonB-dependent receptor [Bacteroidia bacterium]
GLAGPYTLITNENLPNVRGLAAIYGLTFIPGTWVNNISLSKGTGTVVNGFESIAGQIDVGLHVPEDMDKVYLNAYANEGGRLELNANVSSKVNDNWSTALLLHAKDNIARNDRNKDGFLDNPLTQQYIALNRWHYTAANGYRGQFGVKGTYFDNLGGQTSFNVDDEGTAKYWGLHQNVKRIEAWSKTGKVYTEMPWKSMGLQLYGTIHDQESYFGLRQHDATQNSLYANFIYNSIIGTTNHKFKTGASLQYDNYTELFDSLNYDRVESVPGVFFEYTYNQSEKIDVVLGLRADYHNQFGMFYTPRMHLRYALGTNTVARLSGGRGQRTANILAENSGLLASSREIVILGDGSDKPYGLEPEVAWNYGVNLTQKFELDYRDGSFSVDFYRTDFENQIVVDLDRNPQQAIFYNLQGESYSNSFQAQFDYELIKRLDLRLAYRWYDVRTSYSGRLRSKPFVSTNRAFANIGYENRYAWKFDYTVNWQGEKRIPDTDSNPQQYQLEKLSPDFFVMNAQVSKTWREKFEIYVGVENLLDYKQDDPILASADPFGEYFDASMIWGPIFGRMTYAGLRYTIK